MIYDTLLLSELEVMAYKVDYTSATKKQTIDSLSSPVIHQSISVRTEKAAWQQLLSGVQAPIIPR